MTNWTPTAIGDTGPKYQALADAIAADIQAGVLRPGDRLPTHRDLADALGLNVSTVTRGYQEAMHRGLVCGTVGRGTFVAADAGTDPSLISTETLSPPDLIEMGLVTPLYHLDPSLDKALELMAKRRRLSSYLRYSAPGGLAEHREAGVIWAGRYGMPAKTEQVIVCSGVQHGLACCLLSLFRPGNRIAVDQLTYPGLKSLAAMTGIRLVPVEMDQEGMVPQALDAACRRDEIQGLYLMPSVNNPTTACMSSERRDEVAQMIVRHGLIFMEDDAYALTRPDRPAPLASRVPENSVYFAGISKAFGAGLRVCFAVAPLKFNRPLTEAALNTVWMAPTLNAALVSEWILRGEAETIAAAKREEAARRYALAEQVLHGFSMIGYPTSYFAWLLLPPPWNGRSFEEAARLAGVRVFGADKFVVGGVAPPAAARISLTGPGTMEELRRGLTILTEILSAERPPQQAIF